MLTEIRDGFYIGGGHDVRDINRSLYSIISVCSYRVDNMGDYPKYELDDGTNCYDDFKDAVEAVKDIYKDEEDVVVHCNVGQSRSVVVSATVISDLEGKNLENVLDEIREERIIQPHPKLIERGKEYLGQNDSRKPFST